MSVQGFGLERLGQVCLRWPKAALVILTAVSAAAAFGVTRVTFDDDLQALLSSDREVFQVYERFVHLFPDLENQVFLLVEGDALGSPQGLEAVRNLHIDLQFVDHVAGAFSIFSARHPPDANDVADPLFGDELPAGQALADLLDEARRHPLLAGKMLSADGKATLVIVTLKPEIAEYEQLAAALGQIREAVDFVTEGQGLQVVATGSPVFRYEILDTIRRDLQMLTLLGAAIAIAVCFAVFQSLVWTLLASVAPLIGVMWSMGGFGLTGQSITAMSNIVPTLVLVIGFSDALHLVNAIRTRVMTGMDVRAAVSQSVAQVGPACAMTSVTTMIAMASLFLSESAVVKQFAVSGALAVFAAFVAVIAVIPAMAMVLLPRMRASPRVADGALLGGAHRLTAASWALAQRAPRAVVLASATVLILTGATFFSLESRYDYREYLSAHSAANQAIDRINAKLGGADAIQVLIEDTGAAAMRAFPDRVIDGVHAALTGVEGVGNVTSLATVRTWLEGGGAGGLTRNAVLERMPDHAAGRFANEDEGAWLVSGYMAATPAPRTLALLDRVEAALDPVRAAAYTYAISVTGTAAMAATQSGYLIERLKGSLMFAILVVMFVVGLTARSVRLALFSAVPNLMSLTVVAAALFVAGAGFQFTSAIALTVAFGIAVDNTVHFVHRYRLERQGLPAREAVARTVQTVGPVLVAATGVLTLGLLVTQVSALPMVELFGRLCIVILCTALLATLLVMPALVLAAEGGGGRQ